MFHVRVGHESAVYTGDYNMTPDRHLGAAWIDRVRPDVLITETTLPTTDCSYATTIRDSKRSRERDFLKNVHQCVLKGGKVLIPVFALGRAQELCILVESYWERMKLDVPVYFSAGLTERANDYYKLFVSWTNQKIKNTFSDRNMFDFRHIRPFERSIADNPGPMVLFAAPGMLHSGTSLEVFKKWAPDPLNMVILPGYCVAGTVGAKILAGIRLIEFDRKTSLQVKMQVKNLSFSAHADAKGILQLIRQCEPRHVVLVHGEKSKMDMLKQKIISEFKIGCFNPKNGEVANIPDSHHIPITIDYPVFKKIQQLNTVRLDLRSLLRKDINLNAGCPGLIAVKTQILDSIFRTPSMNFKGSLQLNDGVFQLVEAESASCIVQTRLPAKTQIDIEGLAAALGWHLLT